MLYQKKNGTGAIQYRFLIIFTKERNLVTEQSFVAEQTIRNEEKFFFWQFRNCEHFCKLMLLMNINSGQHGKDEHFWLSMALICVKLKKKNVQHHYSLVTF